MNPLSFQGVPRILFAIDRIDQLADDVYALAGPKTPVVLISDAGVAAAGILQRVDDVLRNAGRKTIVFSDLKSEPPAHTVDRAAAVVRSCENPLVIGLGGGSALDVAKLAAVIACEDHPAEAYALCARPLPRPGLKRILIPTTAGTGSEVTRTAIFTTADGRKVWSWGQELLPELVILDPRLTVSLPAQITAASGLDALVHAIEACTNRRRNPLTDAMALHAIRLGKEHLLKAVDTPADLEARSGMLLASTLAGVAFAATGTAAAHSIGHALATIAHIPHGRAVAIAMDVLMDWNAPAAPEAFAAVAAALGGAPRAAAAGPAFRELLLASGLDRSLAADNIDPENLAAVMLNAENKPMIDINPRSITPEDALELARRTVNL